MVTINVYHTFGSTFIFCLNWKLISHMRVGNINAYIQEQFEDSICVVAKTDNLEADIQMDFL